MVFVVIVVGVDWCCCCWHWCFSSLILGHTCRSDAVAVAIAVVVAVDCCVDWC